MQAVLNPLGEEAAYVQQQQRVEIPQVPLTMENSENGNPAATAKNAAYYAKGDAEAATENALTLAKIQHVSFIP